METLEENTIYRLDHNGLASVAYVSVDTDGTTIVYDTNRAWDITGWKEESFDDSIRYTQQGGAYFEFSPLVLEDAHEIFPNTIRTFKDIESFTEFCKKVIEMADSYTPNTEPEETVSFTVDDGDNVLALIKVENDGSAMFKWDNGDWSKIGEDEEPEDVFDQTLIDVEQTDIGDAIKFWTDAQASGQPISKEDILNFAAFDQ